MAQSAVELDAIAATGTHDGNVVAGTIAFVSNFTFQCFASDAFGKL